MNKQRYPTKKISVKDFAKVDGQGIGRKQDTCNTSINSVTNETCPSQLNSSKVLKSEVMYLNITLDFHYMFTGLYTGQQYCYEFGKSSEIQV